MNQQDNAWKRWQLTSFDGGNGAARPPLHSGTPNPAPAEGRNNFGMPTVSELESLHEDTFQSAYQEGLEAGRAAGYSAGQKEGMAAGQAAAAQLLAVTQKLEDGLQALDVEIGREVAMLAIEIARKMLHQTLLKKPETLLKVIEETLAQLPHHHATLYLHPDDVALVREYTDEHSPHAGHRLQADQKLQRGDVIIDSGGAHIDASANQRWRLIMDGLGHDIPWQD